MVYYNGDLFFCEALHLVIYLLLPLQELVEDLKSELSGDFERTILALMMTPAELDATSIKDAVKGAGTDEAALIEVICTRTNEELTAAKEAYKKCVCVSLECMSV